MSQMVLQPIIAKSWVMASRVSAVIARKGHHQYRFIMATRLDMDLDLGWALREHVK